MIQKPRLKSFLTIFPISDTTWGLRGGLDELWRIKLRDARALGTFTSLLPFLTGKHAVDDIVGRLVVQGVERSDALQLLERMEEALLLEEADPCGLSPAEEEQYRSQIAYFSRYTAEGGAKYQARLRTNRIGLVGDGALGRCLQRQLLASGFADLVELGVEPAAAPRDGGGNGASAEARAEPVERLRLDRESIWPEAAAEPLPRLFVVALEADDPVLLQAMDAFSKRHKVPWLLVRAMESQGGWVGPFFIPDETACYLSFQARLLGNLSYFSEQQSFDQHLRGDGRGAAPCGGLHAFFELLSAIAVVEVIKYVTEIKVPYLAGRFLTVNFSSWEVEAHDVLRVPRLGLEVNQPKQFAWKEIPYDDIDAHRAGDIHARRS